MFERADAEVDPGEMRAAEGITLDGLPQPLELLAHRYEIERRVLLWIPMNRRSGDRFPQPRPVGERYEILDPGFDEKCWQSGRTEGVECCLDLGLGEDDERDGLLEEAASTLNV